MYLPCTGERPDNGLEMHCATCYREIDRAAGIRPSWAYIPMSTAASAVMVCMSHEHRPHPETVAHPTRQKRGLLVRLVATCFGGWFKRGGGRVMRRVNAHEHEGHIKPSKVGADANAWAAKMRADAAKRAPAVPAPVTLKGPQR